MTADGSLGDRAVTAAASPAPALARIRPEDVRDAAALVRDGRVWDLGLELDAASLPPLDERYGRSFRRDDLVTPAEYSAAFDSAPEAARRERLMAAPDRRHMSPIALTSACKMPDINQPGEVA